MQSPERTTLKFVCSVTTFSYHFMLHYLFGRGKEMQLFMWKGWKWQCIGFGCWIYYLTMLSLILMSTSIAWLIIYTTTKTFLLSHINLWHMPVLFCITYEYMILQISCLKLYSLALAMLTRSWLLDFFFFSAWEKECKWNNLLGT